MYTIDRHDRVEELKDLPQQDTGAPVPILLAEDGVLVLSYRLAPTADEVAIVEFDSVSAHYFGPPNDEALNGHPLYGRGLRFYGVYEVHKSSWIRALERKKPGPSKPPSGDLQSVSALHLYVPRHDTGMHCRWHPQRQSLSICRSGEPCR
jgi:hypothetical protein